MSLGSFRKLTNPAIHNSIKRSDVIHEESIDSSFPDLEFPLSDLT